MTKVIIHGSKGRMGQMLIACGKKMDGLEIVAGVDEGDSLAHHLANCDAVIDFSLHNATAACAVHVRHLPRSCCKAFASFSIAFHRASSASCEFHWAIREVSRAKGGGGW